MSALERAVSTGVPLLSTLLVLVALSTPAIASPDGDDIAAWRELCAQQLEGDAAIDAWRAFVVAYPDSMLAEVAWGKLHDAGALDESLTGDGELFDIDRSFRTHQAALQRRATHTAVARLEADGTQTIELPSRWQTAVLGGVGYDGQRVTGQVGARLDHGHISFLGRVGAGERAWTAAGLRLSVTGFGPWLEADIDSLGRIDTLLGARHPLDEHVWLEGAAGVMVSDGKVLPAVRFELSRSFGGKPRTLVR